MFERYTEKAGRALTFACDEANEVGSPFIESEHLLLGLLRELKWLATRLSHATFMEEVHKEIRGRASIGKNIQGSADVPLSDESGRVLVYADEEADRLGHRHIGAEHLLLGLLRAAGTCPARSLNKSGVTLEGVRAQMRKSTR
jgi:ATP-dependent Clp protease ATP-binding subunit ClpC